MKIAKWIALGALIASLGACGGGGGSAGSTSAGATPSTPSSNTPTTPLVATAISFLDATPSQIFLKNSGGVDQSKVRFKVVSPNGDPVPGQTVNFSFSTNPSGASKSSTSGVTDEHGEVIVLVTSGSLPGPVKLKAELQTNSAIFAETQKLTISSGPPSQKFMSLSVETYNIEGANIDGVSTRLTARIADQNGNPVEDGTVVNFTAEGGQVASSCTTKGSNNISSCSVEFISQNARPTDGRVSVLAYLEGTKKYTDTTGNGFFDTGDLLDDIGNAYRDDNENKEYDPGEFLINRGGTQRCTVNGNKDAGAPHPAQANTCDGSLKTTVRQQTTILLSSSQASIRPSSTPILATSTSATFIISSVTYPRLPMPAGTSVEATVLDMTPSSPATCEIKPEFFAKRVLNTPPGLEPTEDLATQHLVQFTGCEKSDLLTITVTSPSKVATREIFTFQ